MLCEVAEDGANRVGFFDAGHDPYRSAALEAAAHVDIDPIAGSEFIRVALLAHPQEAVVEYAAAQGRLEFLAHGSERSWASRRARKAG